MVDGMGDYLLFGNPLARADIPYEGDGRGPEFGILCAGCFLDRETGLWGRVE